MRQLKQHGSDEHEPSFQEIGIGVSKLSLFPTEGDLIADLHLRQQSCAGVGHETLEQKDKFSPGKAVAQLISKKPSFLTRVTLKSKSKCNVHRVKTLF